MIANSADLSLGASTSSSAGPFGQSGYVEFSVLVPRNWADLLVELSISKHTSVGHLLREMIDQGLKGVEPLGTTVK